MRVNPFPMPDLIAAMAQVEQQQQDALLQLASGQRINRPSDDPAGNAVVLQIRDRSAEQDSFLQTMGTLTGQLQTADSTLSSVISALSRAITLGTQGATGTLDDAGRNDVASELQGIQDQLISLANTSYQGQYLFSGTVRTEPFVPDNTVTSGIRYDGNTGVNSATIGNGYQIASNVPGSQIFNGANADVFGSMNDLITALQTNTGIDTAVDEVRAAFDYVNAQRVFYGNAMNQITSQQTYTKSAQLQLQQQQNTVSAADMTALASQLVNAANGLNATLAAVGKTSQMSLFDSSSKHLCMVPYDLHPGAGVAVSLSPNWLPDRRSLPKANHPNTDSAGLALNRDDRIFALALIDPTFQGGGRNQEFGPPLLA